MRKSSFFFTRKRSFFSTLERPYADRYTVFGIKSVSYESLTHRDASLKRESYECIGIDYRKSRGERTNTDFRRDCGTEIEARETDEIDARKKNEINARTRLVGTKKSKVLQNYATSSLPHERKLPEIHRFPIHVKKTNH